MDFEDFSKYAAGDWTITETGVGTRALTAGTNGNLLVTNAAADNDNNQFQRVVADYLFDATKKAWFKARVKISDATETDFAIGLMSLDTDVFSSTAGDGVTDGVFFYKDDGSTALSFMVQKNTTTGQNTTTSVYTMVADTFVTLGWYFDANGHISYFINDVQIGTVDASSTYLPDGALALTFAIKNGEAVAKTMTVDYVFAAIER